MTGSETSGTGWGKGKLPAGPAEQLDLAWALAEIGMAAADAAQPDDWKDHVDRVITQMAKTGRPFTSDHVSAITGDSPTGSRGAMGARFRIASKAGLIRRVGYTPSLRPSVHGHDVKQWVGAQAVAA